MAQICTVLAAVVFTLLTAATGAHAAEFYGHSCFALLSPNYDPKECIRFNQESARPFIPILWGTFGNEQAHLCEVLDAFNDRPHLLQVHLTNETCRRSKGSKCYSGEINPSFTIRQQSTALERGDRRTYSSIARRIASITAAVQRCGNKNTLAALSTGLEDEYSDKAFRTLAPFVRARWNGLLIRNPLGVRKGTPADFVERHGINARCSRRASVVNVDGSAFSARELKPFLRDNWKQCFAIATWDEFSQGRTSRKGQLVSSFKPPRERRFVYSKHVRESLSDAFREAWSW